MDFEITKLIAVEEYVKEIIEAIEIEKTIFA